MTSLIARLVRLWFGSKPLGGSSNEPFETGSSNSGQQSGNVRRVRTLQEAQALPPGTIFIDPRGIRRRR